MNSKKQSVGQFVALKAAAFLKSFVAPAVVLMLGSGVVHAATCELNWGSVPADGASANAAADWGTVSAKVNYDWQCGADTTVQATGGCSLNYSNGGTTQVTDGGGCGSSNSTATVQMNNSPTSRCVFYMQANNNGCGSSGTRYIKVNTQVTGIAKSGNAYVGSNITMSGAIGKTLGGASINTGQTITYTSQTTGICTIVGTIVTQVAAGTCTIRATSTATTDFVSSYQDLSWTVNAKVNQTITVGTPAPGSININQTFNVAATASSGLSVAITASGGCVVQSGGTGSATILANDGSLACTVYYNQAGNYQYNAAPQVSSNTTVNKLTQTITFGAQSNHTYGEAPFPISPLATASSGLVIAYSSATTGICTLSGLNNETVNIVAPGTCTINANQSGDATYSAAAQQQRSFTIAKANQTITVSQAAPVNTQPSTPFTVISSASSGLAVAITVSGNCSITSGGSNTATINPTASGSCTVYYNQAGNTNYNAATQVTNVVSITLILQNISVTTPAPAQAYVNNTFTVQAVSYINGTANPTGLNVAITIDSVDNGCTIQSGGSNSAVIKLTSGTVPCKIKYNQAGNATYEPATEKTNTTTAIRINQNINVVTPAPASAVKNAVFSVVASASSGLAVSIASSGGCSGSGTNSASITMTSSTTSCTVTYTQAGNNDYYPANNVTSVTLDGTAPVISGTALSGQVNTKPKYTLTSDEAGTVIHGGSCSSSAAAAAGVNVITLDELAPGTYSNCTIKVRDASGNDSNTLNLGTFTVVADLRVFVKPVASGTGDCSSWANACASLQQAIDIAAATEVWVAKGTYKPATTITLKGGLSIYGGFKGTESAGIVVPAGLTIISGDTTSDDTVGTNGLVASRSGIVGSNLARLMTANNLTTVAGEEVLLSGLVFNASGASGNGGGLLVSNSNVTLDNVQFVALGGVNGGAVSVEAGGQLAVIESVFARNVASGLGGAISMNSSASNTLTVEGTLFDSNVGGTEGGAINQVAGTLAVTNSTFFGNSLTSTATSAKGGAINVGGLANPSNATLKYLTMAKNSAGPSGSANGRGGAINIANAATGVLTLATSLVVDNAAATGANIADMGEITNGGYNIVGFNGISGMVSTAGNTLYNFTSGTSTTATTVSVADVVETALAENGGVTASLRLPAESYARNRIPNLHTECSSATAVGSDQRGKARPDDSEEDCDVGAYEREQASDCSDNNKEEGYSIGFYPGSNTVCFGTSSLVAGSAVHPFYLLLLVMVGLFGVRDRIARLRR